MIQSQLSDQIDQSGVKTATYELLWESFINVAYYMSASVRYWA